MPPAWQVTTPRLVYRIIHIPEALMSAFDPAVMHEVALLIIAITGLIQAIWPNGIHR
jgi:hypothetical protein